MADTNILQDRHPLNGCDIHHLCTYSQWRETLDEVLLQKPVPLWQVSELVHTGFDMNTLSGSDMDKKRGLEIDRIIRYLDLANGYNVFGVLSHRLDSRLREQHESLQAVVEKAHRALARNFFKGCNHGSDFEKLFLKSGTCGVVLLEKLLWFFDPAERPDNTPRAAWKDSGSDHAHSVTFAFWKSFVRWVWKPTKNGGLETLTLRSSPHHDPHIVKLVLEVCGDARANVLLMLCRAESLDMLTDLRYPMKMDEVAWKKLREIAA